MSSCNVILQRRRGYLLTDAAYTNDDGTVAGFGSKVLTIPTFGMAMSSRGNIWATDLKREIDAAQPSSAEDLIARLPEMLVASKALHRVAYPADSEFSAIVYAAYFCKRTRRAVAYIVADDGADMPASYAPFTIQPVLECLGPGVDVDAVLGREVDLLDPDSFDIERDGLAIMEAQRRQPAASIGGFAALTTVSADGITTRVLHTWPDKVGERINPHG